MILKIILLCLWVPILHAWSHLELGAANYGAPKSVDKEHDPYVQYRVLFWTVEELVDRYGPEGTLYVNDIDEAACLYCAKKLRDYIEMQGYPISVISVPGDYKTLDWNQAPLDSIHLKNPDIHFFDDRTEIRTVLQRLSTYSPDGLYLFILYTGKFFPEIEKVDFVDRGLFYHTTDKWEPIDYYGPSGQKIENERVFHIFPEEA